MRILSSIFAASELDYRSEHVQERNEVKNDSGRDEELVGSNDGWVVDLAQDEDSGRKPRLHKDRYVRRLPSRVDFSERFRQITIDTNLEWHARNSGNGAADAACVACRNEDGRNDAEKAEAQRNCTHRDGVEHAALRVEIGGRYEGQNRE